MTDLERARLTYGIIRDFGWDVLWRSANPIPDDAWPIDIIANALAAARREGAEEEAMKWRAERHTWEKAELEAFISGRKAGKHEAVLEDKYGSFDAKVQAQIADAERRGAEEMRARAAHKAVDCVGGFAGCAVGDAIMSLPLTPEEPT